MSTARFGGITPYLHYEDAAASLDWLARVCATLIHVSSVEHDIVNNVVWNYSTLGWQIPTVVPLSGETNSPLV